MTHAPAHCLILACGNTLREDDGVGPWLALWARDRFAANPAVRVLASQQWTPELADDIARAHAVLFIDCSAECAPGTVKLRPVEPAESTPGIPTHHLDASQLLSLAHSLYKAAPARAFLLTVGAGSLELREGFSPAVQAALPGAATLLETTLLGWLAKP